MASVLTMQTEKCIWENISREPSKKCHQVICWSLRVTQSYRLSHFCFICWIKQFSFKVWDVVLQSNSDPKLLHKFLSDLSAALLGHQLALIQHQDLCHTSGIMVTNVNENTDYRLFSLLKGRLADTLLNMLQLSDSGWFELLSHWIAQDFSPFTQRKDVRGPASSPAVWKQIWQELTYQEVGSL